MTDYTRIGRNGKRYNTRSVEQRLKYDPNCLKYTNLDAVLPEQIEHRSHAKSPEIEMLQEVLNTVLQDLTHVPRWPREQQQYEQTLEWIGGAPARLSFTSLCDWLDYDEDALRKALLSLKQNRSGVAGYIKAHQVMSRR